MDSNTKPPIYPAYCHRISPTNSVKIWCPLFAADVHALRQEEGYEGQNIYFHLNHPIKFVCLTGVIVDVNSFENPSGKRVIFTLDDSSGVTIDALIKLPGKQQVEKGKTEDSHVPIPEESPEVLFSKFDFNVLENNIGKTVKIKGILDLYWGRMQVSLRRYDLVGDSNAEIKFWEKAAHFKSQVLGKAWELTEEQVRQCREEAEKNERRQERRNRRALGKKPRSPILDVASKRKPLEKKANPMTGIQNAKATRFGQNDEHWKCPSRTCGRINLLNETRCSLCGLARKAFKINSKTTRRLDDTVKAVWAGEETASGHSNQPSRTSRQPTPQIILGEQTVPKGRDMGISDQSLLKKWGCPSISCGHINSPDLTNCSRCGISRKPFHNKPSKTIADPDTHTWVGEDIRSRAKAEEWSCISCGKNNNPNQSECIGCHLSRESFKLDTKSTSNNRQSIYKQGVLDRKFQDKPGDWTCPCGNCVFGSKSKCPLCSTIRPTSQTVAKSGGAPRETPNSNQATKESNFQAKRVDWNCPSCGNYVFGSKSKCPRCSTTRPTPQHSRQSPEIPMGSAAKPQVRSGDWSCPCGAHNWASNKACYKCHADHMTGKKEAKFRVLHGDWICGSCGKNNYASLNSKACYKCHRPRERGG